MIQKIYTSKYLEAIITTIFLLPVSISFILNPLTNDSRIYQGLAKITDYFGSFPTNVDLTYEVKPIANRMMNYILYKISSVFTIFGTYEYELVLKFLCLLLVFGICYYFSTKFENKYIFLLTSMAFLTPLNFIALQAEWFASLFAFLTLSLFLTDKPSNYYLAGAIITIIFLFKGITILLVVPIVCALYLMKKNIKEQLKYGALGSIVFLWFVLIWNAFGHVISDMLLSAKIARLGYLDIFTMVANLIYNFITVYIYIPIILCGVGAAFLLFYNMMKERMVDRVCALVLMWISTFAIVFFQSEFFIYHYIVLIVPTIITIILSSNKVIRLSLVVVFILFSIFTAYWGVGMQVENKFWGEQNPIAARILENFTDLKDQNSILYLDSGSAPYYFQSNSSCRYVQSLPFQRNSKDWNLTGLKEYQENYKCIMDYDGKYIIMDASNWFVKDTQDMNTVWNKINNSYENVWNEGWQIYRRVI